MITPKDIERKTMTPEKRKMAQNDYFAFYVGRPLSYILSVPFLYTNLSPNAISLISIIPILAGFLVFCLGNSTGAFIIGWVLFFLWNLLDGVDGNIARYKHQFSKLGSVYDATSGYVAMVLTFFAAGVAAAHTPGVLSTFIDLEGEIYIILGALSGIFMIFPRLVMHKTISTLMDAHATDEVKDKSQFNLVRVIALNLSSVTGGAQVLLLAAILLGILDLYTICYFLFNGAVMLASLRSILKEQ